MSCNTQVTKQLSPINKRRSIEELKMKYESSFIYETPKMSSKTKSPKKLKISKVKQMASMFNSKISQIIKREKEVGKYSTLINELSPEPKPLPSPVFVTPVPKPRTRFIKQRAPVPTPRMKSLAKNESKPSACIIAEDVFAKMTVKAKAQLFTQLVEEMAKKKSLENQKEVVIEQSETAEDQTNQSEIDEEKQKSAIDKLVEEAIAKLEAIEAEQNNEIPTPMPRKKKSSKSQANSTKHSADEESESGLSSLPKTSSEESQTESLASKTESSENDYEFIKPLKPLRKKKLRKNNTNKKDVSLKESNQLTSTDSEADNKKPESNLKPKPATTQTNETNPAVEASIVEFDHSLMRNANSPRKIKSVYTLTVNDLETPLNTPRTSLNIAKKNQTPQKIAHISLTDQVIDAKCSITENEVTYCSSPLSSTKNIFEFSTPIKTQEHHSFANTISAKQQLFSPISKPMKNRRKSIYDVESRRNSLAMQVIQEDQPYEPQESIKSNNCFNQTQQKLFANAPTLPLNKEVEQSPNQKSSQFWIKCGDFFLALEINFTDAERLRLLYEIFSQTSCDTKELHFGIDDQKFSVHGPWDMDNISTRIPSTKGSSHYWFSTGDLAIPFTGKYLQSHKIQRLFRVIKETVEETGILRFGVDEVEFSNVPEFWYQPAKFSVESQYSMLVGLQSGDSNGLEGRSKYAWPHIKPVKISDLDESLNEGDSFEEIERGRLSFSPFGSNYSDLASLDQEELSMPRVSQVMRSLDSYCNSYESEPLDQLFEDSFVPNSQSNFKSPTATLPIAEMVNTVQNEQQRLSSVQEHLSNFVTPSCIAKDSLDALKGTPEYVEKLKAIVNEIGTINNFKECSLEELQTYMHFLSRYAEICLSSCGKHMDTVLNALADHRSVVV